MSQDQDPFSSKSRDVRITPWAGWVLLVSTPAGLIVGFLGGTKYEVGAVVLLPVGLVIFLEDWYQKRRKPVSRSEPETPENGSLLNSLASTFVETGLGAKRFIISMSAVVVCTAIAVAVTWFNLAWLAVVIGLVLASLFRPHRGQSGVRAALAFAGIPLALYGVAAGLLQWIVH
jgi:hypothetical protein